MARIPPSLSTSSASRFLWYKFVVGVVETEASAVQRRGEEKKREWGLGFVSASKLRAGPLLAGESDDEKLSGETGELGGLSAGFSFFHWRRNLITIIVL